MWKSETLFHTVSGSGESFVDFMPGFDPKEKLTVLTYCTALAKRENVEVSHMEPKWLVWAREMQTGLTFTNDAYDRAPYERDSWQSILGSICRFGLSKSSKICSRGRRAMPRRRSMFEELCLRRVKRPIFRGDQPGRNRVGIRQGAPQIRGQRSVPIDMLRIATILVERY